MTDQAENLRNIMRKKMGAAEIHDDEPVVRESEITIPPPPTVPISARLITVTSGKGGVGKTNFTINLALSLSKIGKRVAIIDADFGLANIEVLLGIIPKYSIADIFSGARTVGEVIADGPLGIKFLSGGSGLRNMANITEEQISFLIEQFAYLDTIADVILVDTGAGITDSVINFVRASGEIIIITTPEPTSITDAYAVIKSAKEDGGNVPQINVVINRVDDFDEGAEVFSKLARVTQKFLGLTLINLGYIPYDTNLVKAVKKQQPVVLSFPDSVSAECIERISKLLFEIETPRKNAGVKNFIKKLSAIFK
ncbi:site-determining protein [Clostridia bacterium]|nr:site-determining protein [Clostridia bacterium]